MISNEDPTGKTAINHILAGTILNSAVPLAMAYTGMINPAFLMPFYLYQVKAFQAIGTFKKEDASVQSAKKVKNSSYMPFLTLLGGFFATTVYNRYKKRREIEAN